VNPEKETGRIIRVLRNNREIYAMIRANPENYSQPHFLKSFEGLLRSNDHVIGLKVNSSTEKHRITDSIYEGVLQILNDHRGVLMLHCGRWVEMSGWQYGVEVARKYPKTKVILAHMGGTHPDLSFPAIEASKQLSNVYMDTSQTRQLVVIQRGIERLGAERILWGSDMPWGDYLQNLIGISQLGLSETTMNMVLRENFRRMILKDS
jgi:predicted TIM-barrel fold metal-dependent hydrolase